MYPHEILSTIRSAQAEGLEPAAVDERVWAKHGTTCAVLALDSSGMTRTTRIYGIVHFLARYSQMRDLAGALLETHGCLAWRSFADNLFAEFADVDHALSAALEIHRQLHLAGVMLSDEEPYRVSIAVGYGRLLQNGRAGVMGDEMNLTAKLAEDIAGVGETLLSDAAYRQLGKQRGISIETVNYVISQVPVTFHRVQPS